MLDFNGTLIEFNTWANGKVVESLKSCPTIPAEGVKRLSHILENNWYVYDIIFERDLDKWNDDRDYTLDECIAEIPLIEKAYKELLHNLTVERMARTVKFKNVVGDMVERRISDLIFHTFDHCTYHRGQVAMIVRAAGGEPAKTWFNRFITETKR